MFGLSEQEMDLYRDLAQDFAVTDVAPQVVGNAQFMTSMVKIGNEVVPNRAAVNQMATDIETIITMTAVNMAYEYAHLECESELTEEEIIKHLNDKYDTYVVQQFLKYGLVFSADVILEIVGQTILELPYLYASAIQAETFDSDEFLEEKLAAYNDYLTENFSDGFDDDEEDYEGEDEDEEE